MRNQLDEKGLEKIFSEKGYNPVKIRRAIKIIKTFDLIGKITGALGKQSPVFLTKRHLEGIVNDDKSTIVASLVKDGILIENQDSGIIKYRLNTERIYQLVDEIFENESEYP